jgi:glycosyltransferase involved in cell wall biosynthesis
VTLDIFMPFWGSFEHLRLAVQSVLAQDDPDWRLVVVDDVYPDPAPGHWVQQIDDRRVSYIRNTENLRPSRNYNKCVGLAESPFMVLMGCDDVMAPGYVRRVKQILETHPDADIVQPGVETIDETGREVRPLADRVKARYRPAGRGIRALSGESLAVSLLRGNWTYFPSLVWRTAALGTSPFRTDLDVVQDLAKLFELTANGATLVVDDEVVFRYRRHSSSVSAVTGPDGSKFVQEATFFAGAAETSHGLGWRRAERAARWHVSSRLHALTELPAALRAGNAAGFRSLMRHVLGRPATP